MNREIILQIRDAANLVGIVGEKVKLRKQGSAWVGCCPFHHEKTPSFNVVPNKGFWSCFGCGEHGDVIDFVQRTQGLSFEEALQDLAQQTGVTLPENTKRGDQAPEEHILRALDLTQDLYAERLASNSVAMDYLLGKRGLPAATIQEEGLGFAPAGWDDTLKALERLGSDPAHIDAAGLTSVTARGSRIDFLRNRITIPIRDQRGRIIAFAGRSMPDAPADSPKYINTRETTLFKKSETLFHLNRAKSIIRDEGAVIVEGYFDVIALESRGIRNAVAPMGTALTADHLKALGKWTNRITLAFDGDKAGHAATVKTLGIALPAGFDIRLLRLPDGMDPDDWSRKVNGAAKAELQNAPDWCTFALSKAMSSRNLDRMEDRLEAGREVSQWIVHLPVPRQEEYATLAAHELRIPVASILKPQAKGSPRPATTPAQPAPEALQVDESIRSLIQMAVRGGPHLAWVVQIPSGWWQSMDGAQVLESLLDAYGDTTALTDRQQAIIRAAITREATSPIDPKRIYMRLEKGYLNAEIKAHIQLIATHADDPEISTRLQSALIDMRARMARITRGTS